MTDDAEPKVPKVKDLLAGDANLSDVVDAATRAELERWFGLPSFDQLAEKGVVVEDPEMVAVRERKERAAAQVDPALLESLRGRAEVELLPVRGDVKINARNVNVIDLARIESLAAMIAEPRELERPDWLEDDLKVCTPQALLRDLHRSEEEFRLQFEVIDMAAEQTFDIVAEVKAAMATSWKLPPLAMLPFQESSALVDEATRIRRKPFRWDDQPRQPHRWVKNWS